MIEEELLNNDHLTVLFSMKGIVKDICIGVPHHAPLGVEELPCLTHKESDENAGLIGYRLARELKCSFVIACNYIIDPNKCECSDYYKIINNYNPKILVEIHGHGGTKARHDIEVSCGSKDKSMRSERFAEKLKSEMPEDLKKYTICGEYNSIYFQASKTSTINTDHWLGVHIEILKEIREVRNDDFIKALKSAIESLTKEFDN